LHHTIFKENRLIYKKQGSNFSSHSLYAVPDGLVFFSPVYPIFAAVYFIDIFGLYATDAN